MMGSEEHVFNKKLITGSVRTANGAHMKMLCEGDIDRNPSTTPGAEPPRDARDSGSARSHSTQLETSSSDRP